MIGRLRGGRGSLRSPQQDLGTEARAGEANPAHGAPAIGPRAVALVAWPPVCFNMFEANPRCRDPPAPCCLGPRAFLTCSVGPPAFGGGASRALSILLPRPHSARPTSGTTWGQQGRSGQPTGNPSCSPGRSHGQGTSRNRETGSPPGLGSDPPKPGRSPPSKQPGLPGIKQDRGMGGPALPSLGKHRILNPGLGGKHDKARQASRGAGAAQLRSVSAPRTQS